MGRRRARLARLALDTRPLAVVPFRRLVLGQGISWIGFQITAVTVPIQVYDITGSSLWVGSVGLAALIPLVVFGLYGGAVSDAMDRRLLLAIAAVVVWLSTLGLWAQAVLGGDEPWTLLALSVVQSVGFAFATPARQAVIPRLLPPEEVAAGNTLIATVGRFGNVVGPLIAGVAIATGGYAHAYAIDLALYATMVYAAVRLPPIPPLGQARPTVGAVLDGLAYIKRQPILLSSFAVDAVAMVFAMPRALFPEVAAERFGDSADAAVLFAALAVGSVCAGLASGWIGRVRRQGAVLVGAVVLWGLCVAGAGLSWTLPAMCVFLAIGGAADLVSSVFRQTILLTYAPDEMRGRMQGVFIVVVAGGPRVGDLRAGAQAEVAGVTSAWVGGAVASVAMVMAMTAWRPALFRYRPGRAGPRGGSAPPGSDLA